VDRITGADRQRVPHAAGLASARLVRLPRSLEARLAAHARLQSNREACALLFGEVAGPTVDVRKALDVPNRSRSPHRFAIEWADLDNALRRSGDDLVGIFHTHPRGCTPSPSDREGMVTCPVLWLIGGSAADGRLHVEAYYDDQASIRRIPIEIR
jgi:proteasome lid subunit RPN8/RPN11